MKGNHYDPSGHADATPQADCRRSAAESPAVIKPAEPIRRHDAQTGIARPSAAKALAIVPKGSLWAFYLVLANIC